ncbi:uncharacterized protein SPSK_02273 [Sporothrix schenckii 1099-18]|uniref:Uncharacterized protein n=1 Tax=Sporothrix schenckii 1099-18 TaxID=1397361 RepID=A0A0F2M9A2_SPOSC|nr:uncharacterized protein SPSK_02273 [Sporothrix schenckii 1099-18]KJR86283.1 hypothetical protein SPSK_02273 [Sporothrix schenckii 1099-18]
MAFHGQSDSLEIRVQSASTTSTGNGLDISYAGFANRASYDVQLQQQVQAGRVAGTDELTLATFNDGHLLPVRRRAEPMVALRFWDDLFTPSMHRFIASHLREPNEVKDKGSIRGQGDWAGVLDKLETARNEYSQIDSGFKSTFRKVYRKSADHAGGVPLSIVKTAKDVVNNDYASPVLGVVKLVVEAATKAAKLRQDMMGALDNLDHKRLLRATFTIDEYRQKIDNGLKDVDDRSSGLLREVNLSKMESDRLFQSRTIHGTFLFYTGATTQLSADTIVDTSITHLSLAQLQTMVYDMQNSINFFRNELIQGLDRGRAHITGLSPSPREPAPVYVITTAPPAISEPERHHITPQTLLDWIGMRDLARHDLDYMATRNHDHITGAEQGGAGHLVAHHKLQLWLRVPASSQLLIHGTSDGRGLWPVSGLSLFCASLAMTLGSHPRIIRLLFFCGLHADDRHSRGSTFPSDDEALHVGGRAIISSFICQLLCAYDFGPELPIDATREDAVVDGDLDELCGIFGALVSRLPPDLVLVCVVDGAAYYERPEFLADASVVLACILRLSMDDSVSAVVKILVASPVPTTHIRRPFSDDTILSTAAIPHTQWEYSPARIERMLLDDGHIMGLDEHDLENS